MHHCGQGGSYVGVCCVHAFICSILILWSAKQLDQHLSTLPAAGTLATPISAPSYLHVAAVSYCDHTCDNAVLGWHGVPCKQPPVCVCVNLCSHFRGKYQLFLQTTLLHGALYWQGTHAFAVSMTASRRQLGFIGTACSCTLSFPSLVGNALPV